jgi:hypothetical protein
VDLKSLHERIIEDLTEEDARSLLSHMKNLSESPGWKSLAKYLEIYYRSEIVAISAAPILRLDDALPQEFKKGSASAILLLLQLPDMLKLYAENTLQIAGMQQEAHTGDEHGWTTESI